MNKHLLILSADKFSANHLISTLKELPDENNIELDVMVFVQNKHEHILNLIKNSYKGKTNIIYGADVLSDIDMDVRDSISRLISEIKSKLDYIALETGGKKWAAKFDYLWWKTSLHNQNVFRFHRFILARSLGLIFLLISTIIAKTYSNIIIKSSKDIIDNKHPILLYTWFPRVWTNKFGTLQDMYLADLPKQIKTRYRTNCTLVLRIYDKTKFLSPITYAKRLAFLYKSNFVIGNFVILESFGSIKNIISKYFN